MSRYSLLSVENDSKTSKGTEHGYLTGILYLAPAREADGVHDMCSWSTVECRIACLYGAGMAGVFPSIKRARVAKTLQYIQDPAKFRDKLAGDIIKLAAEAKLRGLRPAVRINGTSDIPKLALWLASTFTDIQFYDYTKIPRPWTRTQANYHLTFSFSGSNLTECIQALEHGINVAVVFSGPLPEVWHGYPVIDGDKSDLRFTDPAGVIVGLKAKGNARAMENGGFIQIGAETFPAGRVACIP